MMWRIVLILPALCLGEDGLSLKEAARLAQTQHPSVKAENARMAAAGMRIEAARGGYLPKVNYSESYQRSNNPVFVFSGLLMQRRFTEADFNLPTLNNPDSINNFQSVLSVDQTVFDGGQTRRQVESAQIRKKLTAEEQRLVEMNLAAGAARAYLGVLLAEESLKVATEAVASAEADLHRAESVRAAGMSTDADVLSIKVHMAAMKEQQIRRRSELDVARAALNEALGAPLDTPRQLTTALAPLKTAPTGRESYEKQAAGERPDAKQADLAVELSHTQSTLARAAYLPQVSIRGALEADRGKFATQGGGNWFAGVTLRWNLFNGFTDRSRIRETEQAIAISQSQKQQVSAALQLQVRKAYADLTSASERIQVAEATVAQADESLRIVRNRYESGLSTVTDLLRNQVAKLEASFRRLAAIHDQRVAAAMLELAAGSLTPGSEVLQ
ncbi:MAG: TolC family protein [Bryobacterales bacterium]|nr:TolC family protein [Bryobacterales bacterium]